MGFNNFWNDRADAANDFLRTGQTGGDPSLFSRDNEFSQKIESQNTTNNGLSAGASCISTSQCPSGWGCVNGVCTQLNNGSSGGGNSPGGGRDCDPDDPESPCNSGGPNSCQQTPQCGDTADEARDCCGTRCCSFGSASSSRPGVHCWCDKCPPWPGCTSFCESYLKANGEVGPGCKEGRDGNSCDSCTECDGNVGGECQPIFAGAPCWCEGKECNAGGCQKCDTDTESDNFGDCTFEPSGCQQCATIRNHLCPCNVILPPITVCKPYGQGGLLPINLAQQEAAKRCSELCKTGCDVCDDLVLYGNRCCFSDSGCTFPQCEQNQVTVGSSVDPTTGLGCVTCKTTYPNLSKCTGQPKPPECEQNECNCHSDCPDCDKCSSLGTCVPDPLCP